MYIFAISAEHLQSFRQGYVLADRSRSTDKVHLYDVILLIVKSTFYCEQTKSSIRTSPIMYVFTEKNYTENNTKQIQYTDTHRNKTHTSGISIPHPKS